jgi:endonuclease-3
MNKREQNKIKKINKLLVEKFGNPPRNKRLPDPVDMTIGTILSQNTNDNNSFKAFKSLKSKFNNWDEVRKTSVDEIEMIIKVAGLGKQKAAAIKNFLNEIKNDQGKISLNFLKNKNDSDAIRELSAIKGIGIKTASCVLLFSLNRNVCPVDTHVFRTVNRIGIVNSKDRDKTFFLINENFPQGIAHSFHTNLIRLGREICKPKNPSCGVCPLSRICDYEDKILDKKTNSSEKSFMLLDNI